MDNREAINEIIEIGRLIFERKYVVANDGNISIRMNNRIFISAAGACKGRLTEKSIVSVNIDGEYSPSSFHPTSEINIHLAIYRNRHKIGAIIHAHPPYATSFAVAGIAIPVKILPEAFLTLKNIVLVNYGTPTTQELFKSIEPYLSNSNVFLLANHGTLTSGKTLWEAFYNLEILENTAQVYHLAISLGNVNTLSNRQLNKLKLISSKLKKVRSQK